MSYCSNGMRFLSVNAKITPHLQGMFCLSCLDWHLHFRQPSRCRHIGIFKVSLGSYFEVHIFLLTEMKTAQDP